MKIISNIISYLFHPVLIPLLVTGCYFYSTFKFQNEIVLKYTILQVFVMTFILPILLYFILKSTKTLKSSIMINDLKERKIPIVFNILLVGILIFRFWKYNGNVDIKTYFEAYFISNLMLFLAIYLKQKISIYTTAFSSLIPFIAYTSIQFNQNSLWPICIAILLLGLLMSARLYLKAHTNKEIILGLFCGIIPQLIVYNI